MVYAVLQPSKLKYSNESMHRGVTSCAECNWKGSPAKKIEMHCIMQYTQSSFSMRSMTSEKGWNQFLLSEWELHTMYDTDQ